MTEDRLARAALAVERACAEAATVVELCRRVQAAVAPVVPADRWCGFAVDPATLMATNGYHDEGVELTLMPRLLELEYGTSGRRPDRGARAIVVGRRHDRGDHGRRSRGQRALA